MKHALVLDLNGLLLQRCSRRVAGAEAALVSGMRRVYLRPHARDFVAWALDNFTVAVWSSATRHNVDAMVGAVFGRHRQRLLCEWDQRRCVAVRDGGCRAVFAKPLEALLAAYPVTLHRHRVLLVDDSVQKGVYNQPHTGVHPHSWVADGGQDDDLLASGGRMREWLAGLVDAPSVPEYVRAVPLYR